MERPRRRHGSTAIPFDGNKVLARRYIGFTATSMLCFVAAVIVAFASAPDFVPSLLFVAAFLLSWYPASIADVDYPTKNPYSNCFGSSISSVVAKSQWRSESSDRDETRLSG